MDGKKVRRRPIFNFSGASLGSLRGSDFLPEYNMGKVIVVTGMSGSGKTTLGIEIGKRFPNVLVVDTDEVDDSSFEELYKNPEYRESVKGDVPRAVEMHQNLNREKRDRILEENADGDVVFVGMTLNFEDVSDHIGHYLDAKAEDIFRRVNMRELETICSQRPAIEALLAEGEPALVDVLLQYRFKIRRPFPVRYENIERHNRELRDHYVERGYKALTSDQILEDIGRILNRTTGGYHGKYLKYKEKYRRLRSDLRNSRRVDGSG